MDRRTFLGSAAATGVSLAVGGCVSAGPFSASSGATENVVLDRPDQYEALRESRNTEDGLAYPIHADRVPAATLPAPLHDRTVSTREFVGDRHLLFTFIFTRCPNTCQLLTATLRQVQDDARENGYTDDIALLPITFDPAHDTADVLRNHGKKHGVNWELGNWFYLRPDGPGRAKAVVDETFGIGFERLSDADREKHNMSDEMLFQHVSSIMLVNKDGYVERNYTGKQTNSVTVLDGVETLRRRWEDASA